MIIEFFDVQFIKVIQFVGEVIYNKTNHIIAAIYPEKLDLS